MKIATLATMPNLRLAWKRLSTGANGPYKQYFRPTYAAYELAVEDHLKDLRRRLVGKTWKPSSPERVYVPKPSGLQRPMALLTIEDQVVLQALANVLSRKLESRRRPHMLKRVFSNVLQRPDSIFFLREWKTTYGAFRSAVEKRFRSGDRWILEFDLAAFYDTISHELLLRTAFPKAHDSEDIACMAKWLSMWTSGDPAHSKGHGLPQGPIASDFLAEVFLLPLDEQMSRDGYLRYVDDIRLMAKSESELRRLAITLEVACRERGLIPQSEKYAIRRATSVRDAVGAMPSIADPVDEDPDPRLSESRAKTLLGPAVGGKPLRVLDKTRLRYVLFRAAPSKHVSRLVRLLLPRHPEHVDAFVKYLEGCRTGGWLSSIAVDVIDSSPYEYVRGRMWLLLSTHVAYLARKDAQGCAALSKRAKGVLRDANASPVLHWGAGMFVCRLEAQTGADCSRSARFVRSVHARALLADALPESCFAASRVGGLWLRSGDLEVGLAMTTALLFRRKGLADVGMKARDLRPTAVAQTARALGLTRGRVPKQDLVGEVVARRFRVKSSGQWMRVLAKEYRHALGLLSRAESVFLSARSDWLVSMNAFNQVVFNRLQTHLQKKGLPGADSLVKPNGDLRDFGAILDPAGVFAKAHPNIATPFFAVNRRRNRLPGAHPYERKGGARNRYLGAQERNRFVRELRDAYEEIVTLVGP